MGVNIDSRSGAGAAGFAGAAPGNTSAIDYSQIESVANPGKPSDTKGAGSSTDPKFGDILNKIQAQYGAKAEKPREAKKTLDKDDFLKIMITQMKFQDPTSPFKPEQMSAEMAQFASVEQLSNVNKNLQEMAKQSKPMERFAMMGLIGKWVTVDTERFVHSEGTKESLGYQLPGDAKSVIARVFDQSGEMVWQGDLGPQKKGAASFTWEGLKANSLPAKSGNYTFKIEAKDGRDLPINVSGQGQAQVMGLNFDSQDPAILVGDRQHQQKVALSAVVRVDTEKTETTQVPAGLATGPLTGTGTTVAAPAMTPIADLLPGLKKPEENGASAVPPEVIQAALKQQGLELPSGQGFPNGLKDAEDLPNENDVNSMKGGGNG